MHRGVISFQITEVPKAPSKNKCLQMVRLTWQAAKPESCCIVTKPNHESLHAKIASTIRSEKPKWHSGEGHEEERPEIHP